MQLRDPVALVAKMTSGSAAPALPLLKRLCKSLSSVAGAAALLEQAPLEAATHDMLAFLRAWFDIEERGCVGIITEGHDALDALKHQFAALPALLQQVRDSCGLDACQTLPLFDCLHACARSELSAKGRVRCAKIFGALTSSFYK